ncbi:unnamed protein product [Lathyrus sativus]|nr:unnamed protein product [Lathyrus sativus]
MDPSLEKETEEFWTAIIKFSCKFYTDMMVVDKLKDIEEDLIRFYKKFFQISSTNCRRVMVVHQNSDRVYGNEDGGDDSIEDYDDLYETVMDHKKCKWW